MGITSQVVVQFPKDEAHKIAQKDTNNNHRNG